MACSDAIADYQAAKEKMGSKRDPEALQLAASVATSRAATRIRNLGVPPTTAASNLARAVDSYAAAERSLVIAYEKGKLDTSAEDDALTAAGATLKVAASATGARACAAWADDL